MTTLDLLLRNPLFCLFLTLALGLGLGRISIKGIKLGPAGVLFSALVMGHFGYVFPDGVGKIGLVLFIYCVGISAGGRFFSALRKEGVRPVLIALVTVGSGCGILYLGQRLLDLPRDIAIGLYAGAMSSAPALASGIEVLEESDGLVVGYGIAYPLGIIGAILFIQVLPNVLFKERIQQEIAETTTEEEVLQNVLVEVSSEALEGLNITEFDTKYLHGCQIARRLSGEILQPLAYEDTFEVGQHLLMVGREKDLVLAVDLIGKRSKRHFVRDIEQERQTLQVHALEFTGKTIREIAPLKNYGVLMTRISRYGFTFVPEGETTVELRDVIRVVGQPENIKSFSAAIKHRKSNHDGMEILSLSIGLSLGIFLGMIPFSLPGTAPIYLGLAGGPLIVALLFGYFGHIGKLATHIAREPRELLQKMGLVFFVADAGIRGGAQFLETFQTYGVALLILGALITVGSMLFTLFFTAYFLKMSPLSTLGAISGGMTSTPSLGAITSKFTSQVPVINYATVYPVALIAITVAIKILAGII